MFNVYIEKALHQFSKDAQLKQLIAETPQLILKLFH